jgi:N-acetylmuramoyl-L-alanine amidase
MDNALILLAFGIIAYVVLTNQQVGQLASDSVDFSINNDGSLSVSIDNTSQDVDTLARTAWGEDRSGGAEGMQAVMNVVMNRYALAQTSVAYAQQFGSTVAGVCTKPYQFSAWLVNDPNYAKMEAVTSSDPNFAEALQLAQLAVNGQLQDITGGALYYNANSLGAPDGTVVLANIGGQTYYNYA